MTVRAYLRVSTQAQKEKFSLPAQKEKAATWAKMHDLPDIRYYEDGGVSGTREDRPALTLLMDDLRAGDTVVVYSLTRLGRGGVVQMLGIVKEIEARGARLVSLTEHIDTKTPTGRLLLTLLAAFAELELETTRDRAIMGKTRAALEGHWPHAPHVLPYGMTTDEAGRIIVSEAEMPGHARLFELARAGHSSRSIRNILNREGIAGRFGGSWMHGTVMRILSNPAQYRGHVEYTDQSSGQVIQVAAPALMTEAEWQAAQRTRSTASIHRKPGDYPLTGHLFCACGAVMNGSRVRKAAGYLRYYGCREMHRRTPLCPVHGGKNNNFRTEAMHEQAKARLVEALGSPEMLRGFQRGITAQSDPHAEQRAALERKREALIDLHLDGLILRSEFEARRETLARQIADLSPPDDLSTIDTASCAELQQAAALAEGEHLAELLKLLRVRFVVRSGGVVGLDEMSVPLL